MSGMSTMDRQTLIRLAKGLGSDRRIQAAAVGLLAVSVSTYILFPGFFIGFLFGITGLLAAQAAGLFYLWSVIKPPPKPRSLDKEIVGSVGVTGKPLEEDKDATVVEFLEASELESAMWLSTRPCEAEDETITGHGKLQRKVKEFSPQFRRVQLEGLRLLLTGPNGIHETIYLQGCDVKAFSETEDFKKKWNRKFPLRIRHATRDLWHQSNQVFIYFPNGWQKEMWCLLIRKAIRIKGLQSAPDPGWQSKARQEFSMYRKRVQSLYPDLLNAMVAAPERKGEALETAEGKGPAGVGTMYGIQSILRRRRGKAAGPGGRQGEKGDDWESGSSSSYGSMASFTGSWASSGFLDKSAVAPPLDVPPQELQGFRGKIKSFVASKRALLQDRAALGQQAKGASWSAPEGTPEAAGGESHSGTPPDPGAGGGGVLVSVKDVLESKVKDLGSDILDAPDLQAPGVLGGGRGATDVAPRPRSALSTKPGSPDAKDDPDVARRDPGLARNESESQPQHQTSPGQGQAGAAHAAASSSVQGGSERLESDQGPGGSSGNNGGGATESGLESAISMFDVLVARLFFDIGFQDNMNKKFQEKLQEKLALILTPSGIGTLTCSHFDFGPTPPLVKSLRSATAASGMPDGFLAFDVELVYQGRASFAIETRLDLKDSPYFKFDGLMGDGEDDEEAEEALEEALGKEFDGLVASQEGQGGDRDKEVGKQREKGEEGGEDVLRSSGSAHGGSVYSPRGGAKSGRNSSVGSSPKQGPIEGEAAGLPTGPRRTKSLEPEKVGAVSSAVGELTATGPSSPSRVSSGAGTSGRLTDGTATAGTTAGLGEVGVGTLGHSAEAEAPSTAVASASGEEPAARRSSSGTPRASEGQAVVSGVLYMGSAPSSASTAADPGTTRSKTMTLGSREKLGLSSFGSGINAGPSLSKRQSFIARGLKDMLVNVASGLSQVPLSITVSVTSVQGVLRIWVPPPPTDRLWMSFVDMPELNVAFVPSIGERQLRRFPLATKIVDKLKELIKRTMVLPACNDVPVDFMAADQDDWLPREPLMLPWRPAVIPPPCRSASEAFPSSLSEAAVEVASGNSGRNGEDSEVGWEDEPKADSTMQGLLQAVSGTAKRVARPDHLLGGPSRRNLGAGPLLSTPEQSQLLQNPNQQQQQQQQQKEKEATQSGLLGAAPWRAGPRMGSPSRRNAFSRDASSRGLLAAAKTSFQTATASFVKPPSGAGTASASATGAGAGAGAAAVGGPSGSPAGAASAGAATFSASGAVAVATAAVAAAAAVTGGGGAASGSASKQAQDELNWSSPSEGSSGFLPTMPIALGRSAKARAAEGDKTDRGLGSERNERSERGERNSSALPSLATVNSMRADLRSAAGRAVGLLKGRKEGQDGGTAPPPPPACAPAPTTTATASAPIPAPHPQSTASPSPSPFSASSSSPAPSLSPSPYAWPPVSASPVSAASQAVATSPAPPAVPAAQATSPVQAPNAVQGAAGASSVAEVAVPRGASFTGPASAQSVDDCASQGTAKSSSFSHWGVSLPKAPDVSVSSATDKEPALSGAPSVWYVDEGVVSLEPPPGARGTGGAPANSTQPFASSAGLGVLSSLLGEQSPEEEHLVSRRGSEGQIPLMPGMDLGRISENSEAERGGVRRSASERHLEGGASEGSSLGNGGEWNGNLVGAPVGSREGSQRGGGHAGVSAGLFSAVSNSFPNSGNLGSSEGSNSVHGAREAAADWYELDSLGMPGVTVPAGNGFTPSGADAATLAGRASQSTSRASSTVYSGSSSAGRGASSRGVIRKGSYQEESEGKGQVQAKAGTQSGEWPVRGGRQWGMPEDEVQAQPRAHVGDKVMIVKEDGVVQVGAPLDRLADGGAAGSSSEDSGRWGGSIGGSVRRSEGEEGGREGEEVGLFAVGSGSYWGSAAGSGSPASAYGIDDEGRRGTSSARREHTPLSAAEQLKTRAKDIMGKLGDKEVQAHARAVVGEKAKEARQVVGERATQACQVVGEKAKEAKEKAKKLMSFLKERHAGAPGPGSGRGPDEYY